ncbi:ABC transporter substrate-binding protein [Streptomyces sp. NPDC006476]|uniref:ABC transporter substrate-binding protein n=1 Tax=Streptomyces sp. NPDC006476 TaxID=3157175 RepID=UPI0033A7B966
MAAAAAATLPGCQRSASTASGVSSSQRGGAALIKIGIVPIVDVAPLYLGVKKGFFHRRGISLDMVPAQGGAAIVPGVVSGQLQIGYSNVTSLMIAQSKGMPIKALLNGVSSTGKWGADCHGVAVRKDSPIRSARGLSGHTVAVNTLRNIMDTSVREAVRKDGGDPSKLRFVEMPFDQMPAALAKGQVDAAEMGEPTMTIAKMQGARIVAWPFVATYPDLSAATYFTSTREIQEKPALVKSFTLAMTEASQYASSHSDEVRGIIPTYTQINDRVIERLTLPRWPTKINMASVRRLASLGEKDGIFDGKKPDLTALFS